MYNKPGSITEPGYFYAERTRNNTKILPFQRYIVYYISTKIKTKPVQTGTKNGEINYENNTYRIL